ncbi:ALD2 [Candida oxycetoniae]|uniref:ALD2 n=1 Tax=Candida oxycetoniae TaxID=497107 RepID=A0AAI9SZM7_9ASCO|nr:ALD2 [Candida oxycetoniae]KAI3405899.1 ALD2 [Candida oxycetoniae]
MSLELEYPVTLPDGQTFKQPSGLFINNEYIKSVAGKTLDSINPSTGEINGSVYAAEKEDVDIAVAAAKKALPIWKKKFTGEDRGILLNKIADAFVKNRELLGAIEAWDSGKNKETNAVFDIDICVQTFRYYAGWADKICGKLIQNDPLKLAYTIHEPLGVVGQIIPWNYPLAMAAWKLAPALAAGNTVVLKTSEITPLSLLYFAQTFKDVGFPAGVVNILSGYGATAGSAMCVHPDIAKIAFTGSTATGKLISKMASDTMKLVTLECGGKSPLIIREDADLEQAVKWAAVGIMSNQGQICTSTSRIYVHEKIYETFLTQFAQHVEQEYKQGTMFDQGCVVGPQVSKQQRDKVFNYIEIGKAEGARVVLGGEKNEQGEFAKGYYIKPTIFADVQPNMRIVKEEIFGPVVSVGKFSSDDEAITLANDTSYGLGSAIFTKDLEKAHKMAGEIEAGMVWINSSNDSDARIPFGGVKMSGVGRELGEYGLNMYTQAKAVHVNLGLKL